MVKVDSSPEKKRKKAEPMSPVQLKLDKNEVYQVIWVFPAQTLFFWDFWMHFRVELRYYCRNLIIYCNFVQIECFTLI